MEAEPVLDENDVIQIKIVPQVVEFQGYVDINTRIPAGGPQPDSSKSLSERMVTPFTFDAKARVLPVFSVRKVNASVSLRSGQSVLFIGLRETEKLAPFKPSYGGRTLIVVMTARIVQP
ncbi:MAG: hypothetical protein JWL59_5039 [Chthoniobacteraceae bacterium]|nr:hypothetical protein [Chthoniobacteraceae bacterium]